MKRVEIEYESRVNRVLERLYDDDKIVGIEEFYSKDPEFPWYFDFGNRIQVFGRGVVWHLNKPLVRASEI